MLCDKLFDACEIVRLRIDEALGKRGKILVEYVLPRCGERRDGAAVEAVFQRDDGVSILTLFLGGVFARGFDGTFIRFGAGIAEKHLFHTRALTERFREQRARLRIVEIRGMLAFSELCGDGGGPLVVRIAERVDGDAGAEVDIFLSVLVLYERTLAAGKLDGEARIGAGDIFFVDLLDIHISFLLSGC